MADCELLVKCIFFNDRMASMQGLSELYKIKYCRGENTDCARYQVFKVKGRENVPSDLYPTEMDKAKKIIGS